MKVRLFTIPNLLTLANLLCGAVATVAALVHHNLTAAFWLIAAAAVCDFFDGFAARLLRQSGPLGIQLDSLADDISFGLAPSAMLYALYLDMPGQWLGYNAGLVVFLFAAFAALRLAKFNIDETQHAEFCGLPTPAATLLCASVCALAEQRGLIIPRETIIVLAVGMALLMISPIRMFSLKFQGFGWQGNALRYVFLLVSAVLLALFGFGGLTAVIGLYILISLVRWLRPAQNA